MSFLNKFIDDEILTQIHDCYYNVYKISLKDIEVSRIYAKLPIEIKDLALVWGWNDTEVREKIMGWLSCNNK
jgi:hypothetical protein